jgi:methylglutaconyl-CoA hydratase
MAAKLQPKQSKRAAQARRTVSVDASFEAITLVVQDAVATLTLNRPDVHNAFNETLIAELTRALRALDRNDAVRAVVLAGAGKSFCAGADLNWMKKMAGFSRAQNLADAEKLTAMLAALNGLSKPTIARVHGAAFGGGVGLVACCDIAVAADDAVFALSEVRLGLIPATISPYVVDAIGVRAARRYFLSAERFSAKEARTIGLLHEVSAPSGLDQCVAALVAKLLAAGPRAQAEAKALIRAVAHRPRDARVLADTTRRIARVRASDEAKEGVAAFLGKRDAAWLRREK